MRGCPSTLFLTAIAFSVSAIPTGLPAVVTTILAAGTTTLAAAGAIVKRLRSVETLGSTSAINSDKTGTLTLNQMTAVQMAVVGRRYSISGEGYSTVGQIAHVAGEAEVPLDRYMLPMALCAAVVARRRSVAIPPRGVVLAAKGGVDPVLTRERYPSGRGALRRGLQVHGHLPRHEGRQGQGRHPLLRQGRPGPAAGTSHDRR
jgi:Ca2+-transporting ATPase